MTHHQPLTRFETRRRRVRIHRRDLVLFGADPEFMERLESFEAQAIAEATVQDPKVADFIEWYADEARKYGPPIRAGIAALYYLWAERPDFGRPRLDDTRFAFFRDTIADRISPVTIDGRPVGGREFIQELIWWSAGDWLVQGHVIEAIEEFLEFEATGRMRDWRRRKRRRLAAARRKSAKSLYGARPPLVEDEDLPA
jgi:hypothetical protein